MMPNIEQIARDAEKACTGSMVKTALWFFAGAGALALLAAVCIWSA